MSFQQAPTIRLAESADIPALVEIYRESAEFHKALDDQLYRMPDAEAVAEMFVQALAALTSATSALFVAEEENQVIGYSQVRLLSPASASNMLRPYRCAEVGLAVKVPFRRRGLGAALMQAAHTWAVEHGAELMQLDCHARNEAAIHLYEKLGYGIIGHFMTKRFGLANPE